MMVRVRVRVRFLNVVSCDILGTTVMEWMSPGGGEGRWRGEPHLHIAPLCDIQDEVTVGVVVVVGPAGDGNDAVRQFDVLRIRLHVFRSDHDKELDRPVIVEHLVRPAPDGANALHCCNSIVSYEDPLNHPSTSKSVHELRG